MIFQVLPNRNHFMILYWYYEMSSYLARFIVWLAVWYEQKIVWRWMLCSFLRLCGRNSERYTFLGELIFCCWKDLGSTNGLILYDMKWRGEHYSGKQRDIFLKEFVKFLVPWYNLFLSVLLRSTVESSGGKQKSFFLWFWQRKPLVSLYSPSFNNFTKLFSKKHRNS